MKVCANIHYIINKTIHNYINICYKLILLSSLILTAHLLLVFKCDFPSGSPSDMFCMFLYFSCVLYASSFSSVNNIKLFYEITNRCSYMQSN